MKGYMGLHAICLRTSLQCCLLHPHVCTVNVIPSHQILT